MSTVARDSLLSMLDTFVSTIFGDAGLKTP